MGFAWYLWDTGGVWAGNACVCICGVYGRGMRGICGVAGLLGRAFAGFAWGSRGIGVWAGMRGICGVAGLPGTSVHGGFAWYLQVYGRGMRGLCRVAGLQGRAFAEAWRGVRVGFAWSGYGRCVGVAWGSREVGVVCAGYGWCMGGECVVFAGWPA